MKKPKPELPPACEWDFRQVDPTLIREAAIYEYARSSDKIRALLLGWLDKAKRRNKIRNAIVAASQTGGDPADFYPAGQWAKIYSTAPKVGFSGLEIRSIIMDARPDFPAPWCSEKTRGEADAGFSRVRCYPLENTFGRLAQRSEEKLGIKKILENERLVASQFGDYKLTIDWFADGSLSSVQDVISDFEKWLRAEVRRIKPKMRTGRNSQLDGAAYPLKCLSALRLRRAGFTYLGAANELSKFKAANWIVPYFEKSASWTKAIQFAEKTLADFDAGKISF